MSSKLIGVSERPMVMRITTTRHPQLRDDHRLRTWSKRTDDVTITTDLGVPRSTARGWLGVGPTAVGSLDVAERTEPELRREILPRRCSSNNSLTGRLD